MSEFKYQEPFPLGKDETKYRLLTKDYVHVEECCGRRILRVDARGLELLSREAFAEVSFYLRASHLQQVANILKDPEATDNDKFVAYTIQGRTMPKPSRRECMRPTATVICVIRWWCLSP